MNKQVIGKLTALKQLKAAYLQQMFPQAEEKVPRVRFEGFSGEWVKVSLGEIADITSGITGDASISNGDYKLTRIETISNGAVDMARLGFTNNKPDSRYKLNQGDILYSNINSIEHIGKVAIFQEQKDVYHGINLLRMSPVSVSPYFLYTYFLTQQVIDWAKSRANKAVSQASINQTALSGQLFYVPTRDEQKTIGNFFRTLDELIALHQRKLDALKNLKKTYLQRMFVATKDSEKTLQNTETSIVTGANRELQNVPELRFDGFTEPWTQQKLGEVAELSSSKRIHVSDYVSEGIPFYRGSEVSTGGVSQNDLFISQESYNDIKEKYGVPTKGDLLITAVGTLGNLWKVDDRQFYYKDGNLIRLGDLSAEADYLIAYFSNGQGKKKILDSAEGSSQKALTMVKLNGVAFYVPDKPEQAAIGTFFRNLDELIKLYS